MIKCNNDQIRSKLNTILLNVKTQHELINVKLDNQKSSNIWTIVFNKQSTNTPLILIHGIECLGAGAWILNFESLAINRPVYAIDLLGCGQSSTSSNSSSSSSKLLSQDDYIECIEIWREKMKLNNFYLVGNSFGGFVCFLYAMAHPKRVKYLFLSNPWELSKNIKKEIYFLRLVRLMGPKCGSLILRKKNYAFLCKLEQSGITNAKKNMPLYMYYCNTSDGEKQIKEIIRVNLKNKSALLRQIENDNDSSSCRRPPITFIYNCKSKTKTKTLIKTTYFDHNRYLPYQIYCLNPAWSIDIHYLLKEDVVDFSNKSACNHPYAKYANTFNNIIITYLKKYDSMSI